MNFWDTSALMALSVEEPRRQTALRVLEAEMLCEDRADSGVLADAVPLCPSDVTLTLFAESKERCEITTAAEQQ